ncbi:hypothetical protein DIPPA_01560 [Diplonema papillatum]|nr:hypothetical protein DIPPA_01560 [Diplonema papillatum]|eukprot:gene8958-13870_t
MVRVMSMVICFGVNRGVQMVYRYPARGVGLDLYGREIPESDDFDMTLGVRSDHLSFLLCPQQIQDIPESDIITVESFSFHIRYFHIPLGPIKHLAIVIAVQTFHSDGMKASSDFLDAYGNAIVREQNRCVYLQDSVLVLSNRRDMCDDGKGTWSAVHQEVHNCSLVAELVKITDVIQSGGKICLFVNDWLYLEATLPTNPGHSPFSSDQDPLSSNAVGNGTEHTASGTTRHEDQYTYLMIHPDLPQPLEKELIDQAADIVRDVSLPECLTFLATPYPCPVSDFRRKIERKIAKVHRTTADRVHSYQRNPYRYDDWAAQRDDGAKYLKHNTFQRLLHFLVQRGISRILRTYYVFHPHVFLQCSERARRKEKASVRSALPADESGLGPAAMGMVLLTASRDERAATSGSRRCLVDKNIAFLEFLARYNRLAATSFNVVDHLRRCIDFFDGQTPKEEILARVPTLTPHNLDDLVAVFNEFITTVVA